MISNPASHEFRLTAEKIAKRIDLIRSLIHRDRVAVDAFTLETLPDAAAPPGCGDSARPQLDWNGYWAQQDVHFALRSAFTVPEGWGNPALYLPLGVAGDIFTHPEALLYVDGQPIASADRYHHTIDLDPRFADGRRHELLLHGWSGLTGWPPDPDDRTRLFLRPCFVVDVDRDLQALVTLAEVALDVLGRLAADRPEWHVILNALDRTFHVLDTRAPMGAAFRATVPPALEALETGLSQAEPLPGVTLHAIGHAHMDIAYLWPIPQIRQKNARTAANVLRLMDRYADFRFSQTQPQLLDWLRLDFPGLFDAVRARIEEGRWEVLGGMWVEPDLNMPGPESLVRQIALSRRWCETHLGRPETPVLWLPDTFGFPASLPQLMRQAGLKWFTANKVNWNQTNRLPSSTTWWEGIDGSRVLAHFLTTPRPTQHLPFPTNYKSDLTAAEVLGTWQHSTAKSAIQDLMIAYGYGDGGGGPTDELIRKARIYADMPGAPRMRPSTVRTFFETLEAQAPDLPVWAGEIYLEGHRGVLTSQGWIKQANRMAEALLHDAEYLGACLALRGEAVPDLRRAWELLCVNQFHDILTGTSITKVFDDARRDFAEITALANEALQTALETLGQATVPGATHLAFDGAPLPCPRLVALPPASGYADASNGTLLPGQPIEDGLLVELPETGHGHGFHTLVAVGQPGPVPDHAVAAGIDGGSAWLENRWLRVLFAPDGTLASLFDKDSDREVLADGARGNVLLAFEDRPVGWDAWDIDPFFEDRPETIDGLECICVVEAGPLRATIEIRRVWRDSTICQRISLDRRGRRLDFDTVLNWQERHILLKAAFPVALRAQAATYDIQWGHIERPTHRNTSWDAARFEVAAQKWAHLGEADYGVALLNNGKYGHDIRDNVMRLSLLKSPTSPDPVSDLGEHRFTYSLLPHPGDWRDGVPAKAYALNRPVRVCRIGQDGSAGGARSEPLGPIIRPLSSRVVVETVKPSDDGRGIVVRLYEAQRSRGEVTLEVGRGIASVERAGLLEDPIEPLALRNGRVQLAVTPFEIVTLRLLSDTDHASDFPEPARESGHHGRQQSLQGPA